MADQQAKEATSLGTPPGRPVILASAISCIKQAIHDPVIQHKRTAAVYSKHSEARDRQEVTTRKDASLLARLRSGHSILFQAYKHRLDESTDPTCPRCREAPHTLEHWLDCPGTVQARLEIFGTT